MRDRGSCDRGGLRHGTQAVCQCASFQTGFWLEVELFGVGSWMIYVDGLELGGAGL